MKTAKRRRLVSRGVAALAGALAAALLVTVGPVSASDPPNSEAESDARSGETLPNTGNIDAQGLRERVPPSLFPAITETLQLDGAHEVYGAVQDVSGENTYSFGNPVHSLGAKLGPDGVSISSVGQGEWTWNLKFDELGRGASLDSVSEPSITAEGSRVEYRYPDGVTEWYVNGPLGLQQGFTFESRPDSSVEGPLEVRMTVSGGVTVDVNRYGTSAVISSQESLISYTYSGLYAYDATGAELGARLEATSSGLSIMVDDVGAQYPINIDPFIERGYLVGSAEDPRTGLGMSVAVSGDTVAVGAPNSRWSDTSGVVYLFTVPDSGETSVPDNIVLTSPRSIPGDSFGESVFISGDTIVVGAPSERPEVQSSWSRRGAAYVFTKPAGGWVSTSEASRLSAPEEQGGWYFGMSLAVSGDTVVVGTRSRAAYVFSKPSGGWADTSEAARLTAPNGSEYDRFGQSVTVSGDTVVVGAYLAELDDEDDEEEEFGAAYVFTKPSGGWEDTSDSVMLTAPDGVDGREFGRSLSMNSDTLVVGAPYTGSYRNYEIYREAREAEDKTPYLGAVYVYTKPDTGWADAASPAKIVNPDGEPWTEFGMSVSVNGETIAVGDPEARRAGEDEDYAYRAGAAYVFAKPTEGWSSAAEHRELPMPEIMSYDYYGTSVSVSGEIAVVGAPQDDNENGSSAGSVHLFRMPAEGWVSETPLSEPAIFKALDGPAGDRFGHSVGVDGDLLVVGVPGDHERERGSAYAYVRQDTEWSSWRVRLEASDATPGGRFGTSVAVGNDTMAVGAPGREGGNDPGAVYVFTTPDGGWQRQYTLAYTAKLTIPNAPVDGRFGFSVATDGDTIVVGAPGEGAAYVYSRPEAGWTQAAAPAKLTVSGGGASIKFGHAVSVSGDTIVVGAPRAGAGAAYVFTKPNSGWVNSSSAARLTASDRASENRFGYSVSISGSTVLAGAPGNENGDGTGAAYVFGKPDTGWSNTSTSAKLTASDGAAGDWFGHAVSVSEEFIAVGAHGSDIEAGDQELEDAGAVYAFRRPQEGWTNSTDAQKLTARDAAPDETFGYAVAVSGDTLGVGLPSAIVRRYYHLGGAHSGTARIFTWPGFYWVDTPEAFKISPPNAETSRIFGVSLSADGNTAVVGTVQAVETEPSPVGAGKAFVYIRQNGQWDTSSPAALTLPDDGTFERRGLAVSENGDTVVVGYSPADPDTATEPNSVLVFTRSSSGWASTSSAAKLTMPDGETEGSFGQSVAVSGDTIVVGAYGESGYYAGMDYKGSAFVYTRPNGGWASTSSAAKLTAPAGDPRDEFGRSVAVSGDTVAITAPGDRDIRGRTAGSAYVFERPAGGWASTSESAKLVAPDGWTTYWLRNDFGTSVAVKGDKVVVGAPSAYTGGAYVFTKPDGGWDNPYIVSKLTAPMSDTYSSTGSSVSITDDVIYVGATGIPGQVYIFPIPSGSETFAGSPVTLSDPQGGVNDYFGAVVSAGANAVAVGAPYSDDHGNNLGAVYIFSEPSGGWDFSPGPMGRTGTLVSPDWYPGHLFGASIFASSDGVGVGAPNYVTHGGYDYSGAAYVFTGPFSSMYARDDGVKLSPPEGETNRDFGRSVSLTSDSMTVGAPGYPRGTGAAYIFTKPDGGWEPTSDSARLTSPQGETDRDFGFAVSQRGGTIAVGAIRRRDPGSVYLFAKPAGGAWQSTSDAIEVNAPAAEGLPSFGWSVALSDDTLVVGMPDEEGLGAAYVFTKPSGGWVSVPSPAKLTPSDGSIGDMFGVSVAVSGDTVVVGAEGNDGLDIPGAVYVFTKPATGWASTSETAKLLPETSKDGDGFGWSVAADGDTVAVGAYSYNSYPPMSGAYVFSRPQGGWESATAAPFTAFTGNYSYYLLGVPVGVDGDDVFVGAPTAAGVSAVFVHEDFFDE